MGTGTLALKLESGGRKIDVELDVGAIISVYDKALDVLESAVTAGNANVPEGLLGFLAYIDLLHGGAYKAPAWELPFYDPGVQAQLNWQSSVVGQVTNFFLSKTAFITLPPPSDATSGFFILPNGDIVAKKDVVSLKDGQITYLIANGQQKTFSGLREIALPPGAKPEQAEDIINSAEARIFPKILSDQTHFLIKEWESNYMTVGIFQGVASGLQTLVQAVRSAKGDSSGRGRTPAPKGKPTTRALVEKAALSAIK